jgi:transposase
MQVQTVAAALEIHPFMLSKWRKDARDGALRGRAAKAPSPGPARELAACQALERTYAALQEEHDLLKKAIRFWAARKASGLRSSTHSSPNTRATGSRRSVAGTRSHPPGTTRGASGGKAPMRAKTGH